MRVLIAEDDDALRPALSSLLVDAGWNTTTVVSAQEALPLVDDHDVLVTDLCMPGMDGMTLLSEARRQKPSLEVIVITAFGSIRSAVEAMRLGARTYLCKPFEPDELLLHLKDVQEVVRLREVASRAGRGGLVGTSLAMRKVYTEIDAAAMTDAPVLITGETGTGKDVCARAIHDQSTRRRNAFVAVNLAAIPKDLVESELFGHERGAFTGSHVKKQGRFQLANEGTLFLDEANSLPFNLQPKLLQALETGEIWPLGAERPVKVKARIITAANAELEHLVAAGDFREDLLYRINVLRIRMPALRDRSEDIPQLARLLVERSTANSPGIVVHPTPAALAHLITLPWRGNVRELANAVERAFARAMATRPAGAPDLPLCLDLHHFQEAAGTPATFKEAKKRVAELWARSTIATTVQQTDGNITEAARILNISRPALHRLMTKYAINRS